MFQAAVTQSDHFWDFAVLGLWGHGVGELVCMTSKHIPIYFPNSPEDLVFNILPSLENY